MIPLRPYIRVARCKLCVALVLTILLSAEIDALGQAPVPFTSPAGRYIVFDRGRFKELEPRTPAQQHVMSTALIYMDAEGTIKQYVGGRPDQLGSVPGGRLVAERDQVLVRQGDAWHLVTAQGLQPITRDGREMTLRDSLLVYHDRALEQVVVRWRHMQMELARVEGGSDRPQWWAGANTVLWCERSAGSLKLYHRGKVHVLCDSCDTAIVSAGGDVVAWMDLGLERFRIRDAHTVHDVEDLRPKSFKAGAGMVAYVDGAGRFKLWWTGGVRTLLDHPPTTYDMRDSLLVYVDQGRLLVAQGERMEEAAPFIPEFWQVSGSRLVFLGLDRELIGLSNGQHVILSRTPGLRSFQVFGDTVLFRDADDLVHVWWKGRTYSY